MSVVDENERYLDPEDEIDLYSNCKFCKFFYEKEDCNHGFCTEYLVFMENEEYEDECKSFELNEGMLEEYNEWLLKY